MSRPVVILGSEPFGHEHDLEDVHGAPFWQPGFDAGAWSVLSLPDRGMTPQGTDRAYRAEFTLDILPPMLTVSVQSDDGLWMWLNGVALGHWGGEWQEEGCVNDRAECLETTVVEPLDVTDLIRPGRNVVAARVSNPVMNTYFDVLPECQDPT